MQRREFLKSVAATAAWDGNANAEPLARPSGARFIWYDAQGEGRIQFAQFR